MVIIFKWAIEYTKDNKQLMYMYMYMYLVAMVHSKYRTFALVTE